MKPQLAPWPCAGFVSGNLGLIDSPHLLVPRLPCNVQSTFVCVDRRSHLSLSGSIAAVTASSVNMLMALPHYSLGTTPRQS